MEKIFKLIVVAALCWPVSPALAAKRAPALPQTSLQPLPAGVTPNYQGNVDFHAQGNFNNTSSAATLGQSAAPGNAPAAGQGLAAITSNHLNAGAGLAWPVLIILFGAGALAYFYVARNKTKE